MKMLSSKRALIRIAAACGLAATINVLAVEPAAAPLPVLSFFKHPDFEGASLSPSGRYLAVRSGARTKRVVLAVIDLVGKDSPLTIAASYSDADIRSFRWVTDDRLVYNLIDLASGNADQSFGPGLLSTKRDGSETRLLIHASRRIVRDAGRFGHLEPLDSSHGLLAVPHDGSDDVIVGRYLWSSGDYVGTDALRLNVVTGRTVSLSAGRPDHVVEWIFDALGEPRAVTTQWRGQSEVWWRDTKDAAWRSLARFPTYREGFTPDFVDAAGHLYVVSSSQSKTSVLKRFDFSNNKVEEASVVSTPGFDFDGRVLSDVGSGRPLGVRVETDAETTVWFDQRMKSIQKLADERFPGRVNRLTCTHCDGDAVVLNFSYSDQDPGSYWIYRQADGTWESVGRVRPEIDPRTMATLDLQRIKARDGEDLPVWVTQPKLVKGAPPPPAVVLVHGGPWVRGTTWRWNPETQFLASRGYVVIEPEFRGSTGFGYSHFRKGFKAWGTTMQDDVADAVQWAAAKGLIDGSRVCIAGASYGGYAVLMGLIRHPEAYRCGVAWVAVTDPRLRYEENTASDSSAETRSYSLPTLVGDPVEDAELLKAAAPVEHAADIRAPLLMAFGRDDRRVPLENGTLMREALKASGHDPEYVVYDGEGHGWLKTENNVDWWTRIERFLGKNLH